MSSFDKALAVFDLFQEGRISVRVDDVVELVGCSKATAYRYLASWCDAGFMSPTSGGTYVLGPKIIALDRLMRISDPLLTAGRRVMDELSSKLGINMLLASYYRDSIMCVEIAWPDSSIEQSYERGRPMSLFRGAMAKVILANLSAYQLRNVALHRAEEIRLAGLGDDWPSFRSEMAALAREGTCITHGELMPGALGIAAPVFDPDGKILGSITFAMSEARLAAGNEATFRAMIIDASKTITQQIAKAGQPMVAASDLKPTEKKTSRR